MSDTAPTPAAPSAPAEGAAPETGAPDEGQTRGPDGKYLPKAGESVTPAEVRRYKLRLGDKEEELDEATVSANFLKGRNAAQMLSKAENARREALKAKQEAEALRERLKSKPWEVMRELGLDPRQLSEAQLREALEEETLTPEAKRQRELEKRLREYEDRDKSEQEKQQAAAHEAEVERHKDELASLFVQTMQATGLPKESSRFVMHRLASLYQANEEAGLESTPEEMAAHVVEGMKAEHRGVLSRMSTEEKVAWLGDDFLLELRKHDVARLRARMSQGAQPQRASVEAPTPTPRPPLPPKSKWQEIERLMKEGQ